MQAVGYLPAITAIQDTGAGLSQGAWGQVVTIAGGTTLGGEVLNR
jgi:hypothetical protein